MSSSKINIHKVAEECGVSIATVSRVLHDSQNVREATRQKVLQKIQQLNYYPNSIAQNLRQSRSGTILVIMHDIRYIGHANFLDSALNAIVACDYSPIFGHILQNEKLIDYYINLAHNKQVDGILMFDEAINMKRFSSLIGVHPVVQCGHSDRSLSIPTILTSDYSTGSNVANYLLSKGRTRMCLVNCETDKGYARDRAAGFSSVLTQAGFPLREEFTLGELPVRDPERVYTAMSHLLKHCGTPPDAVFATSDVHAAYAIRAIIECGYRIPEDIAVIGHDNSILSEMFCPPFSSVDQQQSKIAYKAVEFLMESIKNIHFNSRCTIDAKIVERKSSR